MCVVLFIVLVLYVVDVGDVLQIIVWDYLELVVVQGNFGNQMVCFVDLLMGFVVDQVGNLVFLYVGDLYVVGMSISEIQVVLCVWLLKWFVVL